MNNYPSGSRSFGELNVHWNCGATDGYCEVQMWWSGNSLVETTLIWHPGQPFPAVPFSLCGDQGKPLVAGRFYLLGNTDGIHQIVLDLALRDAAPQTHILWQDGPCPAPSPAPCPAPTPAPAPVPVPAEPAVDDLVGAAVITGAAHTDLFAYVYLRPWPGITAQEKEDRFVSYVAPPAGLPAAADAKTSLYRLLAALAQAGQRLPMETLAVSYIDAPHPKYAYPFVADVTRLPAPFNRLAACHGALRAKPGIDLAQCREIVERQLRCDWQALRHALAGEPAEQVLQSCWNSVFALMIVLGNRHHQLDLLIRTLLMARLLSRMLALADDADGADDADDGDARDDGDGRRAGTPWPPSRIADGLAATLILPAALFPMPPSPALPATLPLQQDSFAPYAIGDLELVRQRLKGYALGEVSRIDNVMRGETRETTRRELSRSSHSDIQRGRDDALRDDADDERQTDYQDEAHRSLATEFKLSGSTTYGPPTAATATESIVVGPNDDGAPQLRTVDAAAGCARDITRRAATRLGRRTERERASSSLHERESVAVSRIDGSRFDANARGIHRWVDKIYEAHVENYGHRLMLEFNLVAPATMLAGQLGADGQPLSEPLAPEAFGVRRHTDISLDPAAPAYYAGLIEYYQPRDVALPPALKVVLSATLDQAAGYTRQLAIPPGYQAASATISVSQATAARPGPIHGLVGTTAFTCPLDAAGAPPGAVTGSATIALRDECGTLPVMLLVPAAPGDGAAPAGPSMAAGVDVTATPADDTLEQWKFGFYQAIRAAHERRHTAWLAAIGMAVDGADANPLAAERIVRQALMERMRLAMWQRALDRIGAAELPAVNQGRYRQFFQQAFEWNEMSFAFGAPDGFERAGDDPAGQDNLLLRLLTAHAVRVLLPVRPQHSLALSCFLDSGMLWCGADELAPVTEQSVDLLNELKRCGMAERPRTTRSRVWELRIPTTMTLLQQDQELPVFAREPT